MDVKILRALTIQLTIKWRENKYGNRSRNYDACTWRSAWLRSKVTSLLPGYNCGGCGFPGCSGMAEALVSKDMDHIACKPCKADKRQEIIDYLKNTPGPDGSTIEVKG